LVATIKRKCANISKDHEANQVKRIHNSLKDNSCPILTLALRKKKEKELGTNSILMQVTVTSKIHPSIMIQPLISKKKDKEKNIYLLMSTCGYNMERLA